MSEPKIVDEAKRRPGKCLASRDTEGPFIDTGCWTREHDPYLYLSVRWVKEQAENLLDMVPRSEIDAQLEEMRQQVGEYAERTAELQEFYDSQKKLTKAVERMAA